MLKFTGIEGPPGALETAEAEDTATGQPTDSAGEHSPGRLTVCNEGKCSCLSIWTSDHPVAEVTKGDWGDDYPSIRIVGSSLERKAEAYMEQLTYGHITPELAKANAIRLVAAWNACAGILPTAALESGVVAELVAALEEARPYVYRISGDPDVTPWHRETASRILERVVAVLAKVRGGKAEED